MEKQKHHPSVEQMWQEYLMAPIRKNVQKRSAYTAWHFCNDEKAARELAHLVKLGVKTATSSLHCLYEWEKESLPKVGDFSVVTDFSGSAQCIIRTRKVELMLFNEVSEDFAYKEGEGDRSLEYWRKVHWTFFSGELKEYNIRMSVDMLVVCESFEMVYPIDWTLYDGY